MSSRLMLLAALGLAAGCPVEDPKDSDDTGDTDSASDSIAPTDDTTEDSTPDSGGDTDTDVGGLVTIPQLRSGALATGSIYDIEGAVVTAVRGHTGTDNGFTVQGPGGVNAAVYVDVGTSGTLPAIGDSVDVTGVLVEDDLGLGGSAPNGTRTELEVGTAGTSWTKVGTAALPTPLDLTIVGLTGGAEVYESMLATVSETVPMAVSNVTANGDLTLSRNANDVDVTSAFWGTRSSPIDYGISGLESGGTLSSITGIAHFDGDIVVAPASGTPLTGWVAPAVDTDTDTDTDDSDTDPHTDSGDSAVVGPTDTDTDDSDTDTFETLPTDLHTDTGIGPSGPLEGDMQLLRAGVYQRSLPSQSLYTYIHFEGMIVTAVRQVPPASNYFMVQDPTYTLQDAGLLVYVSNDMILPQIGDEVDLTGYYEEVANTTPSIDVPLETNSQLVILPTDPDASYSVLSSGNPLPSPIAIAADDLVVAACRTGPSNPCDRTVLEKYEGMLVSMDEMVAYDITGRVALPTGTDIRFKNPTTTYPTLEAKVGGFFYDLGQDYSVTSNDTFDGATGVLYFQGGEYKLSVTKLADVTNYVDN